MLKACRVLLGVSLGVLLAAGNAFAIAVSSADLETAITERRARVPEFQQIAQEAQSRGLRVFLAGGLAASYGDFVKHQLLRDEGKMRIDPARLRDQLSNVLLPEQDLDLVIARSDGTAEDVQELRNFQSWLVEKFPYSIDGRSKWDVIGLRTTDGKHIAVEGNPDFARQNNDSLSIGLIELTEPPRGESVIREADHIAKRAPLFLGDLAGDSLHFLESPEHQKTAKALAGDNPEIMGVIRALTKAFQFEKELSPSELARMVAIIDRFDPAGVPENSYVRNWIQGRAKRLISHAYDPESALEIIERMGLLKKLNQLGGDRDEPGTLAWWLNKSALPVRAMQSSSHGKSAAELGISQVAHETSEAAHRLISWRYDGLPRAFLSREGQAGEAAAHGNGFYTEKGAEASHFSKNQGGSTVVFDVDPSAVEGRDFLQIPSNGIVWKNGSKLHVRAEAKGFPLDVQSSCFYRYAALSQNPQLSSAQMLAMFQARQAQANAQALAVGKSVARDDRNKILFYLGSITAFGAGMVYYNHKQSAAVDPKCGGVLMRAGATLEYAEQVCRKKANSPDFYNCAQSKLESGLSAPQIVDACS